MTRIAKKQSAAAVLSLRRDTHELKQALREVAVHLRQLDRSLRKSAAGRAIGFRLKGKVSDAEVRQARFTAEMLKKLRKRLGVSQDSFAKLVGVSDQAVYLWERKSGHLRLRSTTKQALIGLRKIGAREARTLLAGSAR
jgi:DNA-binding transcriptional regulator YiaG